MIERYECLNCGCEFSDPDVMTDSDGLDTPPYRNVDVCPRCGMPGYEEITPIKKKINTADIAGSVVNLISYLNAFKKELIDIGITINNKNITDITYELHELFWFIADSNYRWQDKLQELYDKLDSNDIDLVEKCKQMIEERIENDD